MATNSIGSGVNLHLFNSIDRMPHGPEVDWVREVRAGVDGTSLWAVGTRGREFQVRTVRDTVDQSQAINLILTYQGLVGLGPVPIVYQGVTMPWLVKVLSVEPERTAATVLGRGGILGNSRGICIARWRLQSWVV